MMEYAEPAIRKMSFGEKVKGFLIRPTETFGNVKDEAMGESVKYYTIWLLIYAALAAVIFALIFAAILSMFGDLTDIPGLGWLGAGFGVLIVVMLFVMIIVGGLISLFIGGAWIHLWVWVFGGRNGYGQTVKAIAYGATPNFLLGWIPFIGFIASIWSLVVSIIGVRELHEISTGRAAGAVIIAIIIPVIIWVAIFGAMLMSMPNWPTP
jgi:hypothetical protein